MPHARWAYRKSHPQFRLAVLAVCLTGAVVTDACTDAKTLTPTRPASRSITHQDSVDRGYIKLRPLSGPLDPTCDPGDAVCPQLVSADPANLFQGFAQPNPVTLNFSGLVGSVEVNGDGAIECDGTYGTLVGYDSAGAELGRVDLTLRDPSDCSPASNPDGVTFGAHADLFTSRAMARAVILPMSPLSFPVFDQTGHASATYSVIVGTGNLPAPDSLKVTLSKDSGGVGDTITYTASSRHGSSFLVSSWQWSADTAAPPGYVEKLSVAQCGTAVTCRHTPGTSGTIRLFGTVHGIASSDSAHIRMTLPHIQVACTPLSLTRASATSVTCSAQAAGALAITGWTFSATDSSVGSVARTTGQTSTQWSGMAVASGAVTVQGTVRGVPAISDTGRFAVTPRSGWSWRADTSTGDASPGKFECNTLGHYATGFFGWATSDSTCKNLGLFLWPDPSGSKRGYTRSRVIDGPNTGLWYVQKDSTGMHIRAQVLKDLRPDGATYSVTGSDTVANRCKAAKAGSKATVTTVNISCMTAVGPFKFDSLYAFAWQHERCHNRLSVNAFETIPDSRAIMETIVRPDTATLDFAVVFGKDGLNDANAAIAAVSGTIDQPNPSSFTFWSRNAANNAWFLRTYPPNGIIAPGC